MYLNRLVPFHTAGIEFTERVAFELPFVGPTVMKSALHGIVSCRMFAEAWSGLPKRKFLYSDLY